MFIVITPIQNLKKEPRNTENIEYRVALEHATEM